MNESVVEWPPSPWRILRALYATWRWRLPELDEDLVVSILEAMTEAPSYWLPRHYEGHTRHYMPDFDHGPATSKDKTLDPFAAVSPDQEMLVRWPCDLESRQEAALAQLCSAMPYLGRSESICDARVVPESDLPADSWIVPGGSGALAQAPVRVLVPIAPLDALSLLVRTTQVRKQGRTSPPGSRWVPYSVPPPERPQPTSPVKRPKRPMVDTVVLRLSGKVLPGIRDTVLYGHVLREAAIRCYGDASSPTLSGHVDKCSEVEGSARQPEPKRRLDDHVHAHYLVVDCDGDRLLDTAIVWAREGFRPDEVAALCSIPRLYSHTPDFRSLRVSAAASGVAADVAANLAKAAHRGQFVSDASTWTSVTPFVPCRHQKRRQTIEEFVAGEVTRELLTRNLPAASVKLISGNWLSFRRGRRRGDPVERRAFGVRIEFDGPLPFAQPLALGQLSHFGLGLFRAVIRSGG